MRKQTPLPQTTPSAAPAAQALAALNARLAEIRAARAVDWAEFARLEKSRGSLPMQSEAAGKITRTARELLNGAAVDLLPSLPPDDGAGQLSALRRKIEIADLAIEEGDRLAEKLRRDAAVERFNARAGEVREAAAGVAEAIIGLEHALQKRTVLFNELKLPTDMVPLAGFPLLGRLGRSESMAYRYLQAAVLAGFLSQQEFEAELKASRQTLV